MEFEDEGSSPFLDVLLSRNEDDFSHQVYRKKTHTEKYLHASSHHFPAQKLGVLNTLATRAFRISDVNHFEGEKAHLLKFFNKNGYSISHCLKAFQKAERGPRVKKNPCDRLSGIHLPFIQGTTDRKSTRLNSSHLTASRMPSSA